ncbi:hypothetical protein [Variovorax sp. GT1P44]|uniref:hypothetical protein n=1 Tax=Variovorax sp. GT1P44 TaxID=3443742 RepID=UPI003F4601F1
MVHPTCAPARHPDVPPAGENSLPNPVDHRPTPAVPAEAELDELREAFHAIACVRELFTESLRTGSRECRIDRSKVARLVDFLHAEFQRRAHVVRATIASMQAP